MNTTNETSQAQKTVARGEGPGEDEEGTGSDAATGGDGTLGGGTRCTTQTTRYKSVCLKLCNLPNRCHTSKLKKEKKKPKGQT